MIFQCRNCGKTSGDIDMVLDGACTCGCSHFKLVTENPRDLPHDLSAKEAIRRDLHYWLDLNLDSMDSEAVGDIRVRFEIGEPEE
jgi:predicted  nucleic acid-binding Zn-ribbon protein